MESNEAPVRLGRYRILKEIGRGGMATVYHAVQEGPHGFENHVAVKLIHERLLEAHPRVVKMLVDEARVAARIDHPNVMRILDLVEQENRVYMVMDFVDGISMRGVLDHARETRTKTAIAPVTGVLAAACDGIHAAHQLKSADGTHLNLVHRDMKPGNIMVSIDGQVKVGDFGIALFADRMADSTAQGQLKGTPAYMSPEQTLGGPLDARSDVFSMGLTLYTLATAKLAFRAKKAMHIALKIARESMEPHAVELDGIAAGLGDVLRKACARDPDDRFPDAAALGDALREVQASLDDKTTIPEMLEIAGWRPKTSIPATQLPEDSLYPQDSIYPTPPLPTEPSDAPEDRELTQTLGDERTDANTQTYLPTVTELQTDLDATPIASPRPQPGEAGREEMPAPPQPAAQPPPAAYSAPPAAPLPPDASLDPAPPDRPKPAALPAASAGEPTVEIAEPLGGLSLREPRHRAPLSPATQQQKSAIGRGEKLGIIIAATFLVLTVLTIVVFQFNFPSSDADSQANTPPASDPSTLPGGVAIAEAPSGSPAEKTVADASTTQIGEGEEQIQITAEGSAEDSETEAPEAPDKAAESIEEAVSPKAAVSVAAPKPRAAAKPVKAKKSAAQSSKHKVEEEEAGDTSAIPAEPGRITVSSYPWSEVYIDDHKVGVIPLQEHELSAGIHTIRLVFPSVNNREIVEKIEVRPGKHLRIVHKLKPATEE